MTKFNKLVSEAIDILDADFVMPIDEIRLGNAFAELPKPEEVARKLILTLFQHDNFHVRRVAVQAWRRIAIQNVNGLRDDLLQALKDPEDWVKYDAAWAIREIGYQDKETLNLLSVVADGAIYPDDEEELKSELSNSKNLARLKAAQAIFELNKETV
jgi:HEAT repeat protein